MYFLDKNRIKYFKTLIDTPATDRKKALEMFYIELFLQTPDGILWKGENRLINIPGQESPDCLFATADNQKKGIEIVDWVNDTKQCLVTKILTDIARDICIKIKKEQNIYITLCIDIYDPQRWSYRTREEYLNYVYNPGVKRLQANTKTLKKVFLEAVLKSDNITDNLIEKQVEVNGQHFKLTFHQSWLGYPDFHINNVSLCWQDPAIAMQRIINYKNKKYHSYLTKCNTCDLLIVNPYYSTGNCMLSDKEPIFKSYFPHVFLLNWTGMDISVNKLHTVQP
ncbi:MAG: hypothetical protein PUK24_01620 [Elusimicrobia bacterium]|nr:hypothetical protein [Elusimicrobiota bacterium]MDY6038967.1 hypothetical protein [Elusimicrobiaceae bacterium]